MLEQLSTARDSLKERIELKLSFLLLILSLLERIWLLYVYQPVAFSDTYGSYFRIAKAIAMGGIGAYDGTRVPGYPLLIALLGQNEQLIWIFQLGLGLAITQLLFWISWTTTGNHQLSFLVGLLYNLIPGQFLFESTLLSETLTLFLVLLAFLILMLMLNEKRPKQEIIYAFLLGFVCSFPGMVRPLFFPLTVWFLFFVFLKDAESFRRRFARVAIFAFAPMVIQGGWILTIHSKFGMLSPTTMGGYSLVQHTGAFFELLPDDPRGIRDTYLEFRDVRILTRGTQTNTIWDAIPTLSEVSGLNFFDLSREMKDLSLQLIRNNPDLYLKSVVEGWITFWKAPVYWDANGIEVYARGFISALALMGRWASIASNVLFLLFSLMQIFWSGLRQILYKEKVMVAMFGFIWLTSIVQTLVDHGDNPRFLMPMQMLVIFLVLVPLWTFFRRLKVEALS